ncbi:MAG: transporter [candidate division NC10 bacterium]|nr:transporter [candidate division NC10 bacterium]
MIDTIVAELSYFPATFVAFGFSPSVWAAVLAGSFVGYVVGVLPGLSSVMACAMLLGFVFVLPYQLAFALFMGVYVSSMGAGGITAIMVNIPGTPAAAATCIDGYELAKQGKAREACGLSIMASFVGSVLATLLMLIFLPTFSSIALKFGDWEIFLFCLFGILVCGSLVGTTPLKGWASGVVGLLLAMIGTEQIRAVPRLTFGIPDLMQGVGLVPALIGLFGVSEVLTSLIEKHSFKTVAESGFALVRLSHLTKNLRTVFQSTFVGLFIGFLPGVGEAVSCWFSYDMAKRTSKHKEEFGHGSYEGIIAAEVANNATGPGALIPTLTLGVPGSGTTAIILAALFMIGKRPGPTLLVEFPGFLCELAMLGFMASLGLLLVGLPLSKWAISFLSIPTKALMPIIAGLCVLGAWGSGFTSFSVLIMFIFGIVGSVMKFRGFPVAPMVLGIVIGDIADISLRRALVQYSMDPLALLVRPIGLVILVFLALMLYLGARAQPKIGD